MEPELSLVGYKLRPNQPVTIKDRDDGDNVIWTIHITQFALADDPKPGRNVVSILKEDGSQFVLGTLVKDRCEQFTADFMIRESIKLVSSGASEVHLTGYLTTTELLSPDEDFADLEDSAQQRMLLAAENRLAGREFSDDENTEGSSDEEELMEGSSEDEEDEDEDDEEAIAAAAEKDALKRAAKKALMNGGLEKKPKSKNQEVDLLRKRLQDQTAADGGDDDSSDDDDEAPSDDDDELLELSDLGTDESDDSEAIDSDEELLPGEEDEPVEAVTAPKTKGGKSTIVAKSKAVKRAAEVLPADEKPSKAKKAKAPEAATATPGNVKAAPDPSSADGGFAEWEKAVHALVIKEGPTHLSRIGSNVKKPAGATIKLKKVVTDSKRLRLETDGTVSVMI